MDPFKDFIDRTFTNEFKELTGARRDREDGKLSQEQMNALMRAYDLTASMANLGITAVNIFDTHVPVELQESIKSAIEQVADARTKYRMGEIDVATLRAAIKEGEDRSSEIGQKLKREYQTGLGAIRGFFFSPRS